MNLVVTVIGEDRPGIVERIAEEVASRGGNWLESRMAHLGGQFAGMVRVSVDDEAGARALQDALAGIGEAGLHCVVVRDAESPAPGETPPGESARGAAIEVVGQDRPGIVRQISAVLARHGVNVEELNTRCESAPMSGEIVFTAVIDLALPAGDASESLRGDLEAIGHDLLVDVHWR